MNAPAPTSVPEPPPVTPSFIKDFLDYRKYFRTRSAIRRAEPLHEFSPEQLAANKYLGPWTFNLHQTAVSSLPTVILFAIYDWLFTPPRPKTTSADPFWQTFQDILPRVEAKIEPFFLPLSLTIAAYAAAMGSLKRRDLSKPTFSRNTRCYLYLDGSYGLYPQAVLAFVVTALYLPHDFNWVNPSTPLTVLWLVVFMGGIYATIYELVIKGSFIPGRLFSLQNYDLKTRHFWQRPAPDSAPWKKYWIFTFGLAFLIAYLVDLAFEGTELGISYLLAFAKTRFGIHH